MLCFTRNRFFLLPSIFFLSIYYWANFGNSQYYSKNLELEQNEYQDNYHVLNDVKPISPSSMSKQVAKVRIQIKLVFKVGVFSLKHLKWATTSFYDIEH